jgi:hypothetical protein
MSAPAATAGGARRCLAPLASCATARRTCSGVASQTGAPICGYPALQLAFPSAADGHGFLTGRRGLASELTARAGSAGGGLLPCLTCLALHAPGQLSCLVPCSGLRLCPGRELFRRRAELLAAPLDLLFQLLRVTGSCRLGIGLRVRFRSVTSWCVSCWCIDGWQLCRLGGRPLHGMAVCSSAVIVVPFL